MSDIRGKLQSLCEINYAREGELPVIIRYKPDGSIDPKWAAWRKWYADNGIGVTFMDQRERWTVPSEYPPVSIETSIAANRKPRIRERLEG